MYAHSHNTIFGSKKNKNKNKGHKQDSQKVIHPPSRQRFGTDMVY
jgi:hypothetical protein